MWSYSILCCNLFHNSISFIGTLRLKLLTLTEYRQASRRQSSDSEPLMNRMNRSRPCLYTTPKSQDRDSRSTRLVLRTHPMTTGVGQQVLSTWTARTSSRSGSTSRRPPVQYRALSCRAASAVGHAWRCEILSRFRHASDRCLRVPPRGSAICRREQN